MGEGGQREEGVRAGPHAMAHVQAVMEARAPGQAPGRAPATCACQGESRGSTDNRHCEVCVHTACVQRTLSERMSQA